MKKFKVGDHVVGTIWDSVKKRNLNYSGVISTDYRDDSYYVIQKVGEDEFAVYVEPYDQDTMEHATKLHKLLAGDDNV